MVILGRGSFGQTGNCPSAYGPIGFTDCTISDATFKRKPPLPLLAPAGAERERSGLRQVPQLVVRLELEANSIAAQSCCLHPLLDSKLCKLDGDILESSLATSARSSARSTPAAKEGNQDAKVFGFEPSVDCRIESLAPTGTP